MTGPRRIWKSLLALHYLLAAISTNNAFFLQHGRTKGVELFSTNKKLAGELTVKDEKTRASLIRAALQLGPDELQLVHLVGAGNLSRSMRTSIFDPSSTLPCAVLASTPLDLESLSQDPMPYMFVPLPFQNRQLTLLRAAFARNPVSKAILLQWNSLAVNRDGGLFDNLPYASWTIDPNGDCRDAAGNPILERFHLGKRDAYNRMLGKDWAFHVASQETTIGNFQQTSPNVGRPDQMSDLFGRFMESLQLQEPQGETPVMTEYKGFRDDTLTRRVLELQARELEMTVAEWEYRLAVARNNAPEQLPSIESNLKINMDLLNETRNRLVELSRPFDTKFGGKGFGLSAFVWSSSNTSRTAPYPAAAGYAPMPLEDYGKPSTYTNPYEMFRDILRDQMKAEVIGTLLENTSLMGGTLTLGGAIVLRRIEATKSITVLGENLQVRDEFETFGSDGITGGTTYVVDCDADEAIGMSLACNVPLQIERTAWERGTVMGAMDARNTAEILPKWAPVDPELSILGEGESGNFSATERVAPLRIPFTTTNLFDEITKSPPVASSGTLFPTENPIQSLQDYDSLTNEDKGRLLMGVSNFQGRLPRARKLRTSPSVLDDLLLPLVDESVRRQYQIREAESLGDTARAAELKSKVSKRQIAKEKAESAREAGADDVAEWWDNEAAFLASLRADPTQDEGSYSRFLDRDEWYERQRQQTAERNRKQFGNLFN